MGTEEGRAMGRDSAGLGVAKEDVMEMVPICMLLLFVWCCLVM